MLLQKSAVFAAGARQCGRGFPAGGMEMAAGRTAAVDCVKVSWPGLNWRCPSPAPVTGGGIRFSGSVGINPPVSLQRFKELAGRYEVIE